MSHLTFENRKLISSMITQVKKCINLDIYLLQTKFGRQYNPKKDQINIMEKKSEKERWIDVSDEEEDLIHEIEELESQKRIRELKIKKKLLEKEVGPLPKDDED